MLRFKHACLSGLTTLTSAVLLASCGGSGASAPLEVWRGSSAFELSVLPASFVDGGSLASTQLEVQPAGEQTVVTLKASGARGLKALYVNLDFDAQRYSPAGESPAATLGTPEDTLSLAHISRGRVALGQVLANYPWQSGLSGDATVARFVFDNQPQPPLRQASTPPSGNASRALLEIDANDILNWRYANQGDYDQNSETNLADLTPIGLHFGATSPAGAGTPWPASAALSQVDGDSNGEINIADITAIGANFQSRVESWNIYSGTGPADYPDGGSLLVSLSQASGAAADASERLLFIQAAQYPLATHYWVKPSDGQSEGIASSLLTVTIPQVAVQLPNAPNGSGQSGDPYLIDSDETYSLLVQDDQGLDISTNPNTVYTPSIALDSLMGAGQNLIDTPNGFEGDFSVHIEFKGRPADPPDLYFHASSGQEGFILTNPPEFGTGTAGDPYIVDTATVYVFAVYDASDGDVSTDVNTMYTVSKGSAGSMGAGVNTLDITDGFEGDFNVSATYNGANTMPPAIFLRVPLTPGLYILPNLDDLDWAGVAGSGVAGDPYICSVLDGFNTDFSLAFDLRANSLADGSGTEIDVNTLTWAADPPFIATFVAPGSFTVNQYTNGRVLAQDAGLNFSNDLFIVSQMLPST